MMLGDMLVQGNPPGKLVKALAVISTTMHQNFDKQGFGSRTACILCSLAVRDFFRKIGYTDAQMTPVYLMMESIDRQGKVIHSLGVGDHLAAGQQAPDGDGWDGHVCVRIPKVSYLIDTTVYQTIRPQWEDLPGMIAVPYMRDPENKLFGLTPMAKLGVKADNGSIFRMAWLDQHLNEGWRKAPDRAIERRKNVVDLMVRKFGTWRDQ